MVDIIFIEDVLIFPVIAGIVDEKVKQMLRLANQEKKPVVGAHNGIGIVANPGDHEQEILDRWEEINKRGITTYPYPR